MNQAEFEAKCKAEGYADTVDRRMEPNHFNPEHEHEFDACVLVVEGEMTIARRGEPQLFRAGDICTMAAGTPHTELCGAAGVRYLAGRRFAGKATG